MAFLKRHKNSSRSEGKRTEDLTSLQRYTLMLTQAALGTISPNFRMISIKIENNTPKIDIYLEQELARDLEEVKEIEAEFSVLILPKMEFEVRTHIGNQPLQKRPNGDPTVYVYLRRED